jgi:hypothetical protein
MQIRWAVAVVLLAALAGCGESPEQKYARALVVWNQEIEALDRAEEYVALLENNRSADLAAGDLSPAEMKAVEDKYAPKIAEAKEWLSNQQKLVEKARALRKEADKARSK